MTKQNLHTHSLYDDGNDSIDDMVLRALELGYGSIGFSGHGTNRPLDESSMTPENQQKYIQDVLTAKKKYAGKINIFCGIEQDHTSLMPEGLFDYVIASVHYIDTPSGWKPVDMSKDVFEAILNQDFKGDIKAMVKAYYAQVLRSIQDPKADIIGHLDLIAKYNENQAYFDFDDPEIFEMARVVITQGAAKGLIFEINTGAMARGYRSEPYPHLSLLKEIARQNGKITISSDCHNRKDLDCGRDKAIQAAKEAGFQEIWIKDEDGFHPEPLESC